MGRVCEEMQVWVEEEIETPVEEFLGEWQRFCEEQECNWWCLCCNKWFCWLAWVVVRVVTWVIITVGKWITRTVCEVVNVIIDAIAYVITLILSIPLFGAFVRMLLNWITEIIWRIVGLVDFVASLAGIRPRKKMYFGVVNPAIGGVRIGADVDIMNQVNATIAFYDRVCNIEMIFTGICNPEQEPPGGRFVMACDYAPDYGLEGAYIEFVSGLCKFRDTFRRVIGLGAEIIVFVVQDIPPTAVGCSYSATTNYILIEANPTDSAFVIAHEIGHACLLDHDGTPGNLMNRAAPAAAPTLTDLQISLVRWSRHCVYV